MDVVGRIGRPDDDKHGVTCWFENPRPNGSPAKDMWKRHDIGENYYAKDLEVADLNGDGKGNYAQHIIDRGKESRLGARVADMDGDGDLDIVSAAWDNYKFLDLWRNDSEKEQRR